MEKGISKLLTLLWFRSHTVLQASVLDLKAKTNLSLSVRAIVHAALGPTE